MLKKRKNNRFYAMRYPACTYMIKSGQLRINSVAVSSFDLEFFKYVVLYYDDDCKKIGFKFTNKFGEVGICKAIYIPRGRGSIIICVKNFINHFKIKMETNVTFVFKKSDSMKDFYSIFLKENEEENTEQELKIEEVK